MDRAERGGGAHPANPSPAGPLPTDPRIIELAAVLDGIRPLLYSCPTCQGRGWIEQADPFLGGHLDTRCPDC